MFIRIVKMSFPDEHINAFISIFENNKSQIRVAEGCSLLELYRDKDNPNVFFTYSYWENESYLAAYRQSDLFKSVWTETKQLFNDKPQAWSVDKIVSLP